MVTRIIEQADQLVELIPDAIARVATFIYWFQAQIPGRIIKNLPNLNDLSLQLQQVANWAIIHFYQVFSNSLSLLLNGLLITVINADVAGKSKAVSQSVDSRISCILSKTCR